MYFPPSLKRTSKVLLASSGLAAALLITGCASTKNSTASGPRDEALYLFDDGTGDLPAPSSYAANDYGAELDFTANEQVAPTAAAPQPQPEPRSSRRGRSARQQQSAPAAPAQTQYLVEANAPSQYGANGPGPAGYASSDVLSTPPTPVTGGGNYGPSYAATDSGSAEPVAAPAPAPKKKATASKKATIRTYVVRRGDTLSEIASRNGTSVTSLKSLNGLRSNTIQVGQKLKVSGTRGATATATSGKSSRARSHTVRSGDNLWDISRKYGVSLTALKKVNGMSSSVVRPGQKLKLP